MAAKRGRRVPDTEVQLTFEKSKNLMRKCTLVVQEDDLAKTFVREPVETERGFQRVFATDRFGFSGEKENSVCFFFGGGEKGDGTCATRVLPSFWIGVRRSKESQ